MPGHSILAPEQLEEFRARGVLRVPQLFSAARVCRAREHVQRRLARLGLWMRGAWSLEGRARPVWPDMGLKSSKAIGNKHPDLEALLEEPGLLAIVHELLGGDELGPDELAPDELDRSGLDRAGLDRSVYRRPQVLFTLPNVDAATWTVPTHWHVDVPRLASGRRPGVQVFVFLDTVESRGGGTLVIAGSHRLLNAGRFLRVKDLRSLLCHEPFFRELFSETSKDPADRAHLLGHVGAVGEVALEVVELTGAPGDAWFTDLRALHTASPNAAKYPRMMATHRFVSVDAMRELANSLQWD